MAAPHIAVVTGGNKGIVPAEARAPARYLDAAHGRCDVLVNDAGIAPDRYNMSVERDRSPRGS